MSHKTNFFSTTLTVVLVLIVRIFLLIVDSWFIEELESKNFLKYMGYSYNLLVVLPILAYVFTTSSKEDCLACFNRYDSDF